MRVYCAHSELLPDPSSHLKLVEFIGPGSEEPHVCGALWRHGEEGHLLAPLLRSETSSLLGSNRSLQALGELIRTCHRDGLRP